VLERREDLATLDDQRRAHEAHAAHAEPPAADEQPIVVELQPRELEARAGRLRIAHPHF
jgi:hypothetical protein